MVPVAAYLTCRFRVIIPDQIGFGESTHPVDADYSPPAQAKRLRAFVRALGITNLHLGGNSMGGQIALTYTAFFPEEAESLWLLCPTGIWSTPKSAWQTTIEKTGENPLLVRTPDDFRTLLQMAVGSPVPNIPAPILSILAERRIKNYAPEKRIFEATFSDSVEKRVAGLTTSTLIVWGGNDQMVNIEASRILDGLMPRSQVIVMEKAGHVPILEDPAWAAWDYLKFRAALG